MAAQNTGAWILFENGAQILYAAGSVSAGTDALQNLVPGSFKYKRVHRERVQNKDRGVLGALTVGDQRPQELEFKLYRTSTLETLLTALFPAATTGTETFFTLQAKVPNYDGAAAGESWVWNKCYLPDGVEYEAGNSNEADTVTIRVMSAQDVVVPATY